MDAADGKAGRPRGAGILLHPTSLPGPFGIGDLGPAAYAWVDVLARARQTWWQVLPLGPTGYGDSPYQSASAFAGNPYLVSPELVARDGLVRPADLAGAHFPADRVDYGPVIDFKLRLLGRAWENFRAGAAPALRPAFEEFCGRSRAWLDDFALFMALKDAHRGAHWHDWPHELVLREPAALAAARDRLRDAVEMHKFRQFLFFRQWGGLKRHANTWGIRLVGDAPIFVSGDSADVWANPHLFLLDGRRRPTVVAGVPPDYFSATGQLWGNPLYDWEALRRTHYAWWVARLRGLLEQVDRVRLDHFRGFEAYWAVPAGMPTAETGRWVKGPGKELFEALRAALGGLPLIAEDLGLITPAVEALRDELGLPGMRVLQFAFGDTPANPFLPHNYRRNTIAYTGTHDNDTTRGWYASLPEKQKDFVRRYLSRDGRDIAWDFLRLAWSSVAGAAVAPLPDVLDLGSEARMNQPGRPAGNWGWRLRDGVLTDAVLGRLADLTELYGRAPAAPR
jgi:4-alpha-glucanotransferase